MQRRLVADKQVKLASSDVRRSIEVSGVVQGVGFRPHAYRLAVECQLTGWIRNTARGVALEVQGADNAVHDFVARLGTGAPPLARVTSIAVCELPAGHERGFRILASDGGACRTLIAPDIATCADCLRELFDPTDRRFRYPFINCTNCGPRFTIVHDVPYDRARTSMAAFSMCLACQAEYDDPRNRRFHAQPNACWDCGPRVVFWDGDGRLGESPSGDPMREAAARLHAGAIVAIKGLGGFHLAADAANAGAVERLRGRKRRSDKPLAVMIPSVRAARDLCVLDDPAVEALESPQRPIVLLPKRPKCAVAAAVAPFARDLGLFLPYTPLHHLLLAEADLTALVMTSGNLSDEPIAIENDEALERLAGVADFFLVHDRGILRRCDDSVVRSIGGRVCQVRRSRGFVPVPVFLKDPLPPVLAVGGELKNTVCLTKDHQAFLSQHVGDLENLESFRFFEEAMVHLQGVLELRPEALAYDLHPDYLSTRWALGQCGVPRFGVQHHHAHVASCMAENHVDGRVIGIALDGTGYGSDGCIWGGEVLVADYAGFERVGHLTYVPLPGGAAAIREPWRMAVSHLARHFGRAFLDLPIPFVRQLDRRQVETVLHLVESGFNSPLTSSCGRLFDAVAALLGVRQVVSYEAQAAIELEACLWSGCVTGDRRVSSAYPFDMVEGADGWLIETRPLFECLVRDVMAGVSVATMSWRFHEGLAMVLARLVSEIRQHTALDRVCLSGGTFENQHLRGALGARLGALGFEVLTHSEVPTGDGGLSLGQAVVAAERSTRLPSA